MNVEEQRPCQRQCGRPVVYREKQLCRPCNAKLWRANNREKFIRQQQEAKWKARYGITRERYNDLMATQEGVCAVCKSSEGFKTSSGKSLSVDHDHITGKVRGLLCHNCNRALGFLGDDIGRVRTLLGYLENHEP